MPGAASVERYREDVERLLGEAEAYAARAFALDADSALGRYLRGLIALTRGDVQKSARAHARALTLEPDNAEALFMRGAMLACAGQYAGEMA